MTGRAHLNDMKSDQLLSDLFAQTAEQGAWFDSQGKQELIKCVHCMQCNWLWIKASAKMHKCNVNILLSLKGIHSSILLLLFPRDMVEIVRVVCWCAVPNSACVN